MCPSPYYFRAKDKHFLSKKFFMGPAVTIAQNGFFFRQHAASLYGFVRKKVS